MKFTLILGPLEEDSFTIIVPALPGCIPEGGTKEDALNNFKEAIELYIELLKEDGKPIPRDVGKEVLLDA